MQNIGGSQREGKQTAAGIGTGHHAGGVGRRGRHLERPLTASALHSYLKRLEEKGFLACTKEGKTNVYTPLVSREDYQRSEGRSMLKKLYDGSLSRFAAALYDGDRVAPEEVADLQALLDKLKEGER